MSIAKIIEVSKARKDQGVCERCRKAIKAGDRYLHFTVGFRSHNKRVRCMDMGCYPRPSERESSMLSSVLAAQENAIDQLRNMTFEEGVFQDVLDIVQEVTDVIREVAGEYEEASTNDNGTVFNTTAQERQEELENAADELESWSPSVSEEPDKDADEDEDDWLQSLVDEATEAIDSVSI